MQLSDIWLNIVHAFEGLIVGINSVIGTGSHAGSSALSDTLVFLRLI
ncbi:MAG: hypothetical protein Q3972_09095 [Corynebacterium sp.]|nr:hypothetical protein [Corynebacterium sp.]